LHKKTARRRKYGLNTLYKRSTINKRIREECNLHEGGCRQRDEPSKKTICLVDDEVDIATIIKKGLEKIGHTFHEYNDPTKAWEYFKENGRNCTVVLSDVRMPSMSGFEFCWRVKELNREKT